MTVTTRIWAHGFGVRLRATGLEAPLPDGIEQALRDGIERGFEGERPTFASDARGYEVHADGLDEAVGLLAIRPNVPIEGAATIEAVAIAPAHRGHAFAMRALLAAERQLAREGVERRFAVVPRTNGRGLYFMLRCGFAPMQHPPAHDLEGCTWFARVVEPLPA